MRRAALVVFLCWLCACSGDEGSQSGPPPPTDPADLERTVRDLAAFGEKRVGTPAGMAAATYVRARLEELGFDALRSETFHVPRHEVRSATLQLTVGGIARSIPFEVLEASGAGVADADVIVAGGAEPGDLDDVDVEGKIALVDRRTTFHRSSQYRAVGEKGAVAMLYVSDAPNNLRQVGSTRSGFESMGDIPAISIGMQDSMDLRAGGVHARIDVDAVVVPATGENIIAVLDGALPDQIVIGAHFDTWFSGSCDNGGGVAALLALAERRARRPAQHTLVFVAFDGEEPGLYGGYHFLREHGFDPIAAVLNFEVPSAKDSALAGLGRSGQPILDDALRGAGLRAFYPFYVDLEVVPRLFGGIVPTDIQGLYRHGIPTVSTAVTYETYHTVEDTPDKVDYEMLAQVVDAFDEVIDILDAAPAGSLAARDPTLWDARVEFAGPTVAITVTDAAGAPRAGVAVKANLLYDDFFLDRILTAQTDATGRATFDIPADSRTGRALHLAAGETYPLVEKLISLP